jgi:hypothetical protein
MKISFVGVVCMLSLACTSSTGPIGGQVRVNPTPPTLQLTNESPAPVYIFVIEADLAIRANWAPCTNPAQCRAIQVGATDQLPYTDIAGYTESATHAIVYWWHLVRRGGGYEPDSIRAVGAEL